VRQDLGRPLVLRAVVRQLGPLGLRHRRGPYRREITIDATSIEIGSPDRDAHLRDPDSLDVERFGSLSYRSTEVRPGEQPGHFDPWGGQRAGFSTTTEIGRADFGASWNLVVETGGLVVGKTVRIELEVEAVRKSG